MISGALSEVEAERTVRAMLRRARNREALASVPLVQQLCTAMDESDPTAMLRRLVDLSLGMSPGDRDLYELILRCDLESNTSQEAMAAHMGVSRRHFFRKRANAVFALARHVTDLVGGIRSWNHRSESAALLIANLVAETRPSAAVHLYATLREQTREEFSDAIVRARVESGEVLTLEEALRTPPEHRQGAIALAACSQLFAGNHHEARAMFSDAAATPDRGSPTRGEFEAQVGRFFLGRILGQAHMMRNAALRLQDLAAPHEPQMARATRALIESLIADGRIDEARSEVAALDAASRRRNDVRHVAWCRLFEALFFVFEGSFDEAATPARLAEVALSGIVPDGAIAAALAGEIALHQGDAWQVECLPSQRPRSSWESGITACWTARHLLRDGDLDAAERLAQETYTTAATREYEPLAAMAAATLGALYDAKRQSHKAQLWYAEAVARFSPVHNAWDAFALFSMPDLPAREIGPFVSAEPVVESLARRLDICFPLHVGTVPGTDPVVRRYLAALLRFTAESDAVNIVAATRELRDEAPGYIAHFRRHGRDVAEAIRMAVLSIHSPSTRKDHEPNLMIGLDMLGVTPLSHGERYSGERV